MQDNEESWGNQSAAVFGSLLRGLLWRRFRRRYLRHRSRSEKKNARNQITAQDSRFHRMRSRLLNDK